jgi:hypothetical protein
MASIRIPATATGVITNLKIGLCTIYCKTLSTTVKNFLSGQSPLPLR